MPFHLCLGILTPVDEFQYWYDVSRSGVSVEKKERADHIYELFKPISKDYGGLESMALEDAMELIDITQDTLDDVWKQTEYNPPYPETRMRHLMEIIGVCFYYLPLLFCCCVCLCV